MRMLSGEDRGKAVEEAERLQQSLKLQTMKNSHLEDQMEELKTGQKVSLPHFDLRHIITLPLSPEHR